MLSEHPNKPLATLMGLSAVVLWGSMVGLIKLVSDNFGASLGVPLIYTVSSLILLAIFKFPKINIIAKSYLYGAGVLFVVYELCFAYALGLATTPIQAIEVSILNYLWPCLTIFVLIFGRQLRFNPLVLVGLMICLYGVVYIQTGGAFRLSSFIANAAANPTSYALATFGAFVWAVYCLVVKKFSQGHNPIVLYFIVTAVLMWVKFIYGVGDFAWQSVTLTMSALVALVCAGGVIGLGYGAWNYGMIHGNVAAMVVGSYFTPVLSSLIAMMLLKAMLPAGFWVGVAMVSAGSLVCYVATDEQLLKSWLKRTKR